MKKLLDWLEMFAYIGIMACVAYKIIDLLGA